MKIKNNIVIGLFFIILGTVFLLNNMGVLNIYLGVFDIVVLISNYWPVIFIFIPGVLMQLVFFKHKGNDAGLLIPAGFFTVFGIVMQIFHSTSVHRVFWPGFFISLALAFFETYIFGGKNKKLLIPVYLFGALSILLFFGLFFRKFNFASVKQIIVSIVLVAVGIYILTKKK